MHIIDFFLQLKLAKELIVMIISTLPILEIRGAIPIAVGFFKFSLFKAFFYSFIGNAIIVFPFLLFLEKFSNFLIKHKYFSKLFTWWFAKIEKNKDLMQKYEALGLFIFVAIPLPMTGAWSGCVLAYVFGIKKRYAFPGIIFGILVAGIIVSILTAGISKL